MKHKKQTEYLAYDVTSISSYSENIRELEWGYNRDKEKLPQINMGMSYGEESGLPLYYRVYTGSISDKTHLKYMVADNEFINGKHTRFVMDRGFYSKENLQYLTQGGYRFVIALPGSLKYCQELVEAHGAELINHSEFRLGAGLPYGKSYESTVLGFRMNIHLYYDPEKALRETTALYELLEAQENDLKLMEEPPEKKLHYDRYFHINRSKDGKLGFVRNFQAIDAALKACGFFLIAETDFKKTTAEILDIYRRRDTIEKSFDDLKKRAGHETSAHPYLRNGPGKSVCLVPVPDRPVLSSEATERLQAEKWADLKKNPPGIGQNQNHPVPRQRGRTTPKPADKAATGNL